MPDQSPPSPWDMVLAAINRVESRLDRLVSMDVHQADLRRIDARLDDLAADLGTDRLRDNEAHTKIDARIDGLVTALERERDARIMASRWGIGTIVTCAGVVVALLAIVF